jgi:hypothetical protein
MTENTQRRMQRLDELRFQRVTIFTFARVQVECQSLEKPTHGSKEPHW